jgi:CubicO group peptidase (beta-lactamase class C family)
MKRAGWLAAALALAVAGCATAPERVPPARTFDTIFDDTVARYRLPGLALGIVVDGEVVYSRADGELVAGSGEPVTPDTLFKIASNSKAMTTGVLARLVDAGKLRWTDPVVKHLPDFRMYDPWVTREMQVRDLLIHNSGLRSGAGDLMLWPEPNLFTRADVIAGLAHLKPVSSFRSRYDYDNLLYIVAGEVAAAASGVPYEELVRRELFEPLGMTRCQAGEFRRDEVGNVAQPHMRQGEGNVPIRRDGEVIPASTLAAAGGIRCSLNDMLKWVRMWLEPDLRPAPGAEPWLTRAQRDAIWAAHTVLPISARQRAWDKSRFYAYGYGWRISDVNGVWRVAHTGTLAGMYSALILLPEKRIGIVFMTNGNGADARTVLSHVLVQHFVAPDTVQPVAAYAKEVDDERARRASPPAAAPAITPRTPATAAELARWLGVYHDPWFGEVSVCAASEGVRFASAKSPRLAGAVQRAGEGLLVDWVDETVDTDAWLTFTGAGDTAPVTLTLAKFDPDADFSTDFEDLFFTRVRDCPAH